MFKVQTNRGDVPWQAAAAVACFINAFLACVFGTLLTTGWILDAHLHPWLHISGLLLLVLALPVLILGGHCLDLLENKDRAQKKHALSIVGFVTCFLFLAAPVKAQQSDSGKPASYDFFRDVTFNVTLDGYYGYNFNRPVGGINLLRAYDTHSNSFSLNQAALIIEDAPNLEKEKRYGLRLDLQYGQATETVQGSAANELRPQVYRNLWQAYGTYVFDVGKGLTVDFGKFAGALGYETNYTKDNFNYTRSYFYNFLPFYHFGFRTAYSFNDKLTVTHWLVNGVQQSEDFNGFKSQALLLTWKPAPKITSQFNYYNGQEQRDRSASGRLHVFDTYHTFNLSDKWVVAVEGDYVVGRVFRDSEPASVWGGAGYARYQWTPKFAVAGRFEYLSEKVSPAGGLFSGVSQALKEHTITAEYKFADGFLGRAEYRRDFSNQLFFLTEQPGILKKEQNTATLGLVWWFGRKGGTW